MTSRKNIKIFYFNGVNVAKHWQVAGEVFAISDGLVVFFIALIVWSYYCRRGNIYVLFKPIEYCVNI